MIESIDMKLFNDELSALLKKHGAAIIAKSNVSDANDFKVEIGFQVGFDNNHWIGRHHVTGFDLNRS
ncbi:MAG TPA: hypothetical protein DDW91_17810 [Shewanella frigidimarina]|nr:hypothetical protein [Shewanella frigidimarina]